ncbi:hypothetical protein B0H14DRAFT_3588270 [Mycena olivaceomarginata]|nr:hypothetical protein B0H14DRAFT_3588270 [Mycena olivaceomarginata]
MLSTKLVYLALDLGVLGAPLGTQEEARSVNSLNGGKERPVWVERDVNSLNGETARPVWVERDVNSLNGGTVRPVWVERDVNSLSGGAVRPVWVERDVNQANDQEASDLWIVEVDLCTMYRGNNSPSALLQVGEDAPAGGLSGTRRARRWLVASVWRVDGRADAADSDLPYLGGDRTPLANDGWVESREEHARSVNSLNGGHERPVWVERDIEN